MRNRIKEQLGITLIEIILVIAIILSLTAVVSPFASSFILRNRHDTVVNHLKSAIKKSQVYAMENKDDQTWGVCYVNGDTIRTFSGDCNSPVFAEDYQIPNNITLSGLSTITFNKRGEPSITANITVSSALQTDNVDVNGSGALIASVSPPPSPSPSPSASPTPTPTPSPTLSPTPSPSPYNYEAENYSSLSGVSIVTDHAGYSGTGFGDYGGDGTWLEWDFVNEGPGSAILTFRYANGSGGNRQSEITINGSPVGNVAFPPTGAWTNWSTDAINVNLPSSLDTIRVTANTSSGGPNLDRMEVAIVPTSPSPSPSPSPTPTPTPSPSPTPTTCQDVCLGIGYDAGTCRANTNQCNNNGEDYQSSGDPFCTGGGGSDTCCCLSTSLIALGSITSESASEYCYEFTVENNSSSIVYNWQIDFDVTNFSIYTSWNGTYSLNSGHYVVTPLAYNMQINVGQSFNDIGFCANKTGTPYLPANIEITTLAQPPSDLSADFDIYNNWGTGYCANIEITNNGSSPVYTWELIMQMNNSTYTGGWSATYTNLGSGQYRVQPLSWNSQINAGQTINSPGFCANINGSGYQPTVISVE